MGYEIMWFVFFIQIETFVILLKAIPLPGQPDYSLIKD